MFNKILLITVAFHGFSLCSSSFLWRINTTPAAYIFGTAHVPYKLVWPFLSNEVHQVFKSSSHFYAEGDLRNESYWDEFLQCLRNNSKRIRRSDGDLLDFYLLDEARRLNKTIGSLESPTFVCERERQRHSLPIWVNIINHVKKNINNLTLGRSAGEFHEENILVKRYLCDELERKFVNNLLTSKTNRKKMEKRDKHISKHIHQLLSNLNNQRYFFAMGAAHMLASHNNVLLQLKKYGYRITRMCTFDKRIRKKFACKQKSTMKNCVRYVKDI